jgi:phage shock protein PspC (stress-responsive transcriptional regulator)
MANKAQMNDQAAKGGLLGVFFYVANKYNLDPEIVLVLTPVIAALLASLSTKVGDPEVASFFSEKQETKSEN